MSDPFNIVKDELKRSINKTRSLIESYNVLLSTKSKDEPISNDEVGTKLLADIRTNLKSINWDIQDLEETITIASKNPAKFNLTNADLESRRLFINQTREFVQKTKQTYNIEFDETGSTALASKQASSNTRTKTTSNVSIKIPDLISNATTSYANKSNNYQRLNEQENSDNESRSKSYSTSNNHSLQMQHEDIFREQDRNLDLISGKVSTLKNISTAMQNELDDQAVLLDDLGREMDTADSKMQTVMKKLTKVLHMTSDRRQWTLIGILLGAILVVLILFAIL